MSARLAQLRKMLEKSPRDPFLLYGVALELKKAGDLRTALEYLDRTLAIDADYMYAYFQKGQILETVGQPNDVKLAYDAGIKRAQAAGDAKALGELTGAREMLD
jgi:tetratricopeptide (TPR) repeat protein